jgi:hypothetical protein
VKDRTIGTTVVLSPHERFWLEVIRMASNDTDPVPTLERTQKLRLLFSGAEASAAQHEAHHGR